MFALYYDFMSPPSRVLYVLLKLNKIPFRGCPVALRANEHFTDEYKQVNRFRKVPAIVDGDFKLSESVAILRYLSRNYNFGTWYPHDSLKQARVDEFLEWQHNNLRVGAGLYFQLKWLIPILTGQPTPQKRIEYVQAVLDQSIDTIENVWLADHKFLTGDEITVADLFAASDMEQPSKITLYELYAINTNLIGIISEIAGYNVFENRPKLTNWLTEVKGAVGPLYDEAHKYVWNYGSKFDQIKMKFKL